MNEMSRLLAVIFCLWVSQIELGGAVAFDYADADPAPWNLVYTIYPLYSAQSFVGVWKNEDSAETFTDMPQENTPQEGSSYFDDTRSTNKTARFLNITQTLSDNENDINDFSNNERNNANRIWRKVSGF